MAKDKDKPVPAQVEKRPGMPDAAREAAERGAASTPELSPHPQSRDADPHKREPAPLVKGAPPVPSAKEQRRMMKEAETAPFFRIAKHAAGYAPGTLVPREDLESRKADLAWLLREGAISPEQEPDDEAEAEPDPVNDPAIARAAGREPGKGPGFGNVPAGERGDAPPHDPDGPRDEEDLSPGDAG